jgi:hypothetical protein
MSQVEIGAKVSVDTGSAAQNVLTLQQSVAKLKEEFKNSAAGSEEQKQAFIKLQQAQNDLKKANGDLQKSMKGTEDAAKSGGEKFGNLKTQMASISPAAGGAAEAASKFNGVLNILKANPIIAVLSVLVAIIIGLVNKFKEMDGAADAMGDAWNEVSGIFSKFINAVLTPMIDGFVKLIGALTSAVEWIADKLGVSAEATSKRMGQLAKTVRELDDAQKDQALATAESNRKLQEAREIAGDANVPIKERIKALKDAGRIEKEELDKVVALNVAKTAAQMEQMALEMGARGNVIAQIRQGTVESLKAARAELLNMKNVNKDKLYALDQQIIDAENAAAQSAKIGKKVQSQVDSLNKEEISKAKEAAAEKKRIAVEAQKEKERLAKEAADKQKKLDDDIAARVKAYNDNKAQQAAETEALILKNRLQAITDANFKAQQEIEIGRQGELDKQQETYNKGLISLEEFNQRKSLINANYDQQQAAILAKQAADKQKKADDDAAKELKKKQDEANAGIEAQNKIASDSTIALALRQQALDKEVLLVQQAFDAKLMSEEDYNKKSGEIKKSQADLDKSKFDAQMALLDQYVQAINGVADIVGKNTVAGKALSVSAALISTYEGIAKAVHLGFPAAIPAAISAAATGFGAVKNILAVKVPGKSGGGGNMPSVPGGGGGIASMRAPLAPMASTSTTSLSGQTLASMNATASRAYVVEADIANNQDRISRINRAARIG